MACRECGSPELTHRSSSRRPILWKNLRNCSHVKSRNSPHCHGTVRDFIQCVYIFSISPSLFSRVIEVRDCTCMRESRIFALSRCECVVRFQVILSTKKLARVGLFQHVDLRRHFVRENYLSRWYEREYHCYKYHCLTYSPLQRRFSLLLIIFNFVSINDVNNREKYTLSSFTYLIAMLFAFKWCHLWFISSKRRCSITASSWLANELSNFRPVPFKDA